MVGGGSTILWTRALPPAGSSLAQRDAVSPCLNRSDCPTHRSSRTGRVGGMFTGEVVTARASPDDRDLETLGILPNVKGQGRDTRGRKRSTGRSRGKRTLSDQVA